jgi:hypothetical protein
MKAKARRRKESEGDARGRHRVQLALDDRGWDLLNRLQKARGGFRQGRRFPSAFSNIVADGIRALAARELTVPGSGLPAPLRDNLRRMLEAIEHALTTLPEHALTTLPEHALTTLLEPARPAPSSLPSIVGPPIVAPAMLPRPGESRSRGRAR